MMKRQSCHFCGFSGANGAARRSPNTARAVYLFDDDLFPKFYFNVKSQKYRKRASVVHLESKEAQETEKDSLEVKIKYPCCRPVNLTLPSHLDAWKRRGRYPALMVTTKRTLLCPFLRSHVWLDSWKPHMKKKQAFMIFQSSSSLEKSRGA